MLFSTVRMAFLTVKHFWDFPVYGYRTRAALNVCKGCLLEKCIFFLEPSLARNIKTYPLLLREDSIADQYQKGNEKQGIKKKFRGIKVSVINEHDVKTYMYLEDLEKYAKRNNLSLEELGSSTKEKPAYKLQRVSSAFETQNVKKVQSKKVKQILLREAISKNDLLIKINQILKFLEKENKVLCVIESRDNEKVENIINEMNTNGLQGYSFQKIQTNRNVKLTYEPKCTKLEETS